MYPSHYNSFQVILICPLTSPLQLFQITFILFFYITIATPWEHFHFTLLFHLHNFIVISSKMLFLCHHFSLCASFLHEIFDPIFDNFVLCVAISCFVAYPQRLAPKYWGKLFCTVCWRRLESLGHVVYHMSSALDSLFLNLGQWVKLKAIIWFSIFLSIEQN